MTTKLTISVRDAIAEQIETSLPLTMSRSEHIEELIRDGYKYREIKKGERNGIKRDQQN